MSTADDDQLDAASKEAATNIDKIGFGFVTLGHPVETNQGVNEEIRVLIQQRLTTNLRAKCPHISPDMSPRPAHFWIRYGTLGCDLCMPDLVATIEAGLLKPTIPDTLCDLCLETVPDNTFKTLVQANGPLITYAEVCRQCVDLAHPEGTDQ